MRRSKQSSRNNVMTKTGQHRLNAYAMAARAAGVALLALAPAADAEVIFTPRNVHLQNGSFSIDVNNDGGADFFLTDRFYSAPRSQFPLEGRRKLAIHGNASGASVVVSNKEVAALSSGANIGSSRAFRSVFNQKALLAGGQEVYHGSTGTCCFEPYGNWEHASRSYVGLRFELNGQTHYGWARLTVNAVSYFGLGEIHVLLSGYAYETTPNQSIKAGQTRAADQAAEPMRGTLGQLAKGAGN